MFKFKNKLIRSEIIEEQSVINNIVNNENYKSYLELLKTDLSYEEKMFRICNMFNIDRLKILTGRGLFICKDKVLKINLDENSFTIDETNCKDYLVSKGNLFLASILYPIEDISEDGNIAVCPLTYCNGCISTEDYMAIQTVLVKNHINVVNAKSRNTYTVENDKLYLLEYFNLS